MEDQECPRCGSLLPIDDEGLCHTCGYVFGHATVAMPALKKKANGEIAQQPQVAASAPVTASAAEQKSGQGKMVGLLVGIGLLTLLVIGAIIGIVVTSDGGEAPPPPVESVE